MQWRRRPGSPSGFLVTAMFSMPRGAPQIVAGDTQGAIATYKNIHELFPRSVSAMEEY
jgi:hypothetical protein